MPRLATLATALLLLLAATAACTRPGTTTTAAAAAAARATDAATAITAGDDDEDDDDDDDRYSVYDLGSTWRDQDGRERTLESLRGRPRLVAMIYTHCATSCPLAVADMKRVERETGGAGVEFVLVSLDPERDSPAQLARFARDRDLDADRWTLLRGSDDDVRELAAALGVRYRRLSPDELAHSNTLTLLDASGAVAYQRAGLGGTGEIVAAVRALGR